MTDKELGCKCEAVQKWLQKRSKAFRKDIRMQKFANAINGEQDVQNAEDPTKFITNADLQNEIFSILTKSETEVISKNEHNTVIGYLVATIIYKNSQWLRVIQNMTIEEFECRKDERKNRILISILKHKTASSTGPADIVINKYCEEIMSWYTITQFIWRPLHRVKNLQLAFFDKHWQHFQRGFWPNAEGYRNLWHQNANSIVAQEGDGHYSPQWWHYTWSKNEGTK